MPRTKRKDKSRAVLRTGESQTLTSRSTLRESSKIFFPFFGYAS